MTPQLRRRALLVGTEHHDDARLVALPCTRVDTAQLDEVLSNPAIGGFETVNIAHDLPAAALRSAIAEFLDGCEEDELALLYISGHGARLVESGGEFFFIATDSDVDDLARSAVGAGFVNERLEGCLAPQKVAVLDCCHSGGFALGFRTVDGTAKFVTSARAGVPLAARGVTYCPPPPWSKRHSPGADRLTPRSLRCSPLLWSRPSRPGRQVGRLVGTSPWTNCSTRSVSGSETAVNGR